VTTLPNSSDYGAGDLPEDPICADFARIDGLLKLSDAFYDTAIDRNLRTKS